MSMNMKDFVIIQEKNQKVEASLKYRKDVNDEKIEKKRQFFQERQDKIHEYKLKDEMETKQLKLKHNKAANNVIQLSLKRLEQIQLKREVNNLKK